MLLPNSQRGHLSGPDSRAGNRVLGKVLVEVEEDAGLVGSVEGGEVTARRGSGTAASDLDVDALGVGLGAVGLASGVKADDLVAEDVVAGSEAGGDLDGPGVAVGNEVVRGPVTGVGARVEASLVELDELERGLVDRGEVAGDGGDVVGDGAVVGLGPGVPLEGDGTTSGDLGGAGNRLGLLVADDVGGGKGIGSDEAVVLVGSGPADSISGGTVRDTARVLDAIGDNLGDVTVGLDGDGHGKGGKTSAERHVCFVVKKD